MHLARIYDESPSAGQDAEGGALGRASQRPPPLELPLSPPPPAGADSARHLAAQPSQVSELRRGCLVSRTAAQLCCCAVLLCCAALL